MPRWRWPTKRVSRGVYGLLAALGVALIAHAADLSGLARTSHAETPAMPDSDRERQEDLRQRLTPLQYRVTQEDGTEPPFANTYWDNTRQGIYVDVVSGVPLFSSIEKFKSGTGWPSFTAPIQEGVLANKTDRRFGVTRTEIRDATGDTHLGHLFNDGPAPTGLRYCINSAALRFIPVEDLEKEGYGKFLALFNRPESP